MKLGLQLLAWVVLILGMAGALFASDNNFMLGLTSVCFAAFLGGMASIIHRLDLLIDPKLKDAAPYKQVTATQPTTETASSPNEWTPSGMGGAPKL